MSGRIRVEKVSIARDPYDRVCIAFSKGSELRFRDTRKFGRITWYSNKQLEILDSRLGNEPLSESFTEKDFSKIILSKNRGMKALLLDQSIIAGLGNIYVDESLWAAKISPNRVSSTLKSKELKSLYLSIRRILKKAIEANGTDFGDGVVHEGKFVTKVYGRGGMSCMRCRTKLVKMKIAGRGTVMCIKCQK